MLDVEAFILVGGASSRMGSDKSRLTLGDLTSVERLVSELRPAVSRISVVGSRPGIQDFGLRLVPDVHKQWGALGGIHAALADCLAQWAFIVACDLPFVTFDLLRRLIEFAQQEAHDAIVPIQIDRRPQPLCALYQREHCFKKAEQLIAQGEHMPRALMAAVDTRWVEFDELSDLNGAEDFFFNMNTPEEYERAQEILNARYASHTSGETRKPPDK